jgi:hypothetical protein
MERSRWTDERLDDLVTTTRDGFDRVDRRFEQVDKRFEHVDRRFEQVHSELRELRQWMFRLTMGMSLGFISVLATILARGA